jgi:hypothetical protein
MTIRTASVTTRTVDAPAVRGFRPWWLWLATMIAFPLAGLAGRGVGGRIDDVRSAVFAGLAAGAVIGAGQWLLLRRRGVSVGWIPSTAVGFAVGLAAGAAAVSYQTDRASLALMGAATGLAVGLAQAIVVRLPAPRFALWTAATAGLYALGWTATGGIGFPVEEQWPVFGASGVLIVAFAQSLFIERVLPLQARRSER